MRLARSLSTIALMAILALSSISASWSPEALSGECVYFNETGHQLCGDFLQFYRQRGGLTIFGYPLTEAFEDPSRRLVVQYFQRARMERHPRAPAPYKVQLGLLVDDLGYRFPPARPEQIPSRNTSTHHYFPETKHSVSYAFLDYFRENGGLDIFGYPRSEFMYEDGFMVQYFQRARMEWHPEVTSGPQIQLTNLGEIYIERFGVPGGHGVPRRAPSAGPDFSGVRKLHACASVYATITGQQGMQTVFVYVNDQNEHPIQGADVRMVVHYPTSDRHYNFKPTDSSGFTRYSFKIEPSPQGHRVVIDVTVTSGGLTATSQTFFLPWW